jgi:hypothetical protein
MTSASWSLQSAIHDRLVADADLVTRIGGPRIWDHVPRGAAFPYVTYGTARTEDWSTGDSTGQSHTLVLHVWSRAPGRREALAIGERITTLLDDTTLTLDGHRVVVIRVEAADVVRQPDGQTLLATLRLRALTEPA